MPIDASIIMGLKAPQIQQRDPMEEYGSAMRLKALMGQQELQGLQTEQAKRGMARDESVRDAYRRSGGDSAALRELLRGSGNFEAIQALDKHDLEVKSKQAGIDKDTAAAGKSRFEVDMEKLQRGAAILGTAKDQASYETALRMGVVTGVFKPEDVAKMPPEYSPQTVAALQNAGLTRAQQMEQEHKAATLAETGRHNLAGEQNTVRGQDLTATVAREGHGVTRRGQDLNATVAREGHGVTRRGQDMATTGKDAPEALLKAAGYGDRMRKAEAIISGKGVDQMPGYLESFAPRGKVGTAAANVSRTPERQKYFQAAEDWVRAKLRQESGAVIADDEMEREIRTYFPQLGDKPEVIAQKAQARRTAEQAMVTAAGRAATKSGATAEPTLFNAMPDAAKYAGKRIESDDGTVYKSDGTRWVKQ